LAAPSLTFAQQVMPIAEALESTKKYDFFMVEGTIVDSHNQFLYRIEDSSGVMPIYVKEHMIREQGELKRGDRIRIWGRFEQKKLDQDVEGMMVSRIYRLPAKVGASGRNNPGADVDTDVVPIDRSALPAAPSIEQSDIIKPMASEEFKQRARAALQAYRKAEQDAVDAGQVYARAAREAGSDGQVDAAILDQLQDAEARVVDTRSQIHALTTEAREAGIDEAIVQMIEHEGGLR